MGITPTESLRRLRLTAAAAQMLTGTSQSVLETAIAAGFDSHDGFTKAFTREFHLTPSDYRRTRPPVAWFIASPVRHYYSYLDPDQETTMTTITCTVTIVDHPAARVLLQRAARATEYWSYCDEKGCEWEGLLASIPERLCPPALLTLPTQLTTPGASKVAAGVELPAD